MKRLILLAVVLTSSVAFADGSVEISKITESSLTEATASLPVTIKTLSGKSVVSTLGLIGTADLRANSIPVRETFVSEASLLEHLKTHYCGITKQMTGNFVQTDNAGGFSSPSIVGKAKITSAEEVTHVRYEGADSSGNKVDKLYGCP